MTTILTVLVFVSCVLRVISVDVVFSGFEEDKNYTYILNGDNDDSNLTCIANTRNESISFQTSWYENGSGFMSDGDTLHFSNVSDYTEGGTARRYYCNANNTGVNSSEVIVHVIDYSIIRLSYNGTEEWRNNMNQTVPVALPVLTQRVILTCNTEEPGWAYKDRTTDGDEFIIDVMSLDWIGRINCTRRAGFVATSILLIPIGSGLALNSLLEPVANKQRLEITQDTVVLCVTSDTQSTRWFYRGSSEDGSDEVINGSSSVTVDNSELVTEGVVRLVVKYPLLAGQVGFYSCNTYEKYLNSSAGLVTQLVELVALERDQNTTTTTYMVNTTQLAETNTSIPTQTTVTVATTNSTTQITTYKTTQTTTNLTTQTANITISTNTTLTRTTLFDITNVTTTVPTINTQTTHQTISHNITNDITTQISPNTTSQTTPTTPNITTQISPNTTSQTTTTTPNITTQISPNTTSQTTTTTPNITTQISPNTTSQTTTTTPNITTQATTTRPNITTQTTTTTPNITQTTTTPNTTIQTTTTTTTTTPNITIQTTPIINPNSTTKQTPTTISATTHNITTQTTQITTQLTNTSSPIIGTATITPNKATPSPQTMATPYTSTTTTNIQNVTPTSSIIPLFHQQFLLVAIICTSLAVVLLCFMICVFIICLCCILKRKRKPQPWIEGVPPANSVLSPAKYTQLREVHTPAPLISPTKKMESSASSPVKLTTNGYMELDAGESADVVTELGTELGTENLTKGSVDSLLSQSISLSSIPKYQDDPNSVLIELQHYKLCLDKLVVEKKMEKQFESLGGQELRYTCNQASLKHNFNKNKYKSIFPYDKSRVTIRDTSCTGSDYINASHIPGLYVPVQFIAAQAPKPNTVCSFWTMVWEQGVRTIVSLTNLVELGKTKCTQYWPSNIGESIEHGSVHVCLQKEEIFSDYIVRDLLVSGVCNRKIRTRQYHYTAWSDHHVPQSYNDLLTFIQTVKNRERKKGISSVVVHCSAGVGRTGIFIALYNIQEAVGQGTSISVYRVVNEMREYRPHMVQTFSQYRYIYLSILEIIMGCTSIVGEDYRDTFSLYQQAEEPGYLSVFGLQFEELNYQTEKCYNYESRVAYYPENVNKNVAETVVPYDCSRVVLSSPSWDCDYINASYIRDYELIAAPLPRENTMQEFLQLIYQLDDPIVVVMLSKQDYEVANSCDVVRYWCEERGSMEFGAFKVETESLITSPFFLEYRMKVYSEYENKERRFSQYISYCWDETDKCTDTVAAITLLDHVSIHLAEKQDRVAMFSCKDSIGKTGVMLSVYLAVLEAKLTRNVDMFQVVKRLRSSRNNMVPTIEHYICCHTLLNEYFKMNMT